MEHTLIGGAAVVTPISTGGLSLIGFGINALVDSSASAVLVWRFRAEAAGHADRARRAELLALRLAGMAFLLIALYRVRERAALRGPSASGASRRLAFSCEIPYPSRPTAFMASDLAA